MSFQKFGEGPELTLIPEDGRGQYAGPVRQATDRV